MTWWKAAKGCWRVWNRGTKRGKQKRYSFGEAGGIAGSWGGLTSSDGRKIRNKCLIRASNLSVVTPADREKLVEEYRLSLVVDLRTDIEREQRPDLLPKGVDYLMMPVFTAAQVGDHPGKKDRHAGGEGPAGDGKTVPAHGAGRVLPEELSGDPADDPAARLLGGVCAVALYGGKGPLRDGECFPGGTAWGRPGSDPGGLLPYKPGERAPGRQGLPDHDGAGF